MGRPAGVGTDRLGGPVAEGVRTSVMRRRSGVMASSLVEGTSGREVRPPPGCRSGSGAGQWRVGRVSEGAQARGGVPAASRGVAFGPPRSGLVLCVRRRTRLCRAGRPASRSAPPGPRDRSLGPRSRRVRTRAPVARASERIRGPEPGAEETDPMPRAGRPRAIDLRRLPRHSSRVGAETPAVSGRRPRTSAARRSARQSSG